MNLDPMTELRQLANEYSATITFDAPEDDTYSIAQIRKENIDFDVLLKKASTGYFAYALESELLPRELFYDIPPKISLEHRNHEVIEVVRSLLGKKVKYHLKKRLFRKSSGYVNLEIDGRTHQVPLESNVFGLEIAG